LAGLKLYATESYVPIDLAAGKGPLLRNRDQQRQQHPGSYAAGTPG
jgi:hypothetical protein